tara:strand:- start:125 stop:274 length:150 start_codon:yes stop_codon:yes gene_type:complete
MNTKDIYTYQQQALDLLDKDHPHYNEIKSLLLDQIEDELNDHAHSISNK